MIFIYAFAQLIKFNGTIVQSYRLVVLSRDRGEGQRYETQQVHIDDNNLNVSYTTTIACGRLWLKVMYSNCLRG